MILTVTPNPAVDVTYRVDQLRPCHSHRVREVSRRAGGKGINVARVLTERGVAATVLATAGGASGDTLRDDLTAVGIDHELVPVECPTRSTVTVVESADGGRCVTAFNEQGDALADPDWNALLAAVSARLASGSVPAISVLTCSGSLPAGVADDGHARLVELGHAAGIPVITDCGGRPLLAAAEAGADVVKPNMVELRAAVVDDDPVAGARRLLALGAGAAVVTLGEDGAVAVSPAGVWRATPSRVVAGNATGAGDAAVAALASGIARGARWPELLRDAVAWSAAAVAAPLAGSVDAGVLAELRDDVRVWRS